MEQPTKEHLGQNMILKMPEGYSNASVVVNPYPIHTKVRAKKETTWGPAICLFWGFGKPESGCSNERMQRGATPDLVYLRTKGIPAAAGQLASPLLSAPLVSGADLAGTAGPRVT